jgi:hypothetical protein
MKYIQKVLNAALFNFAISSLFKLLYGKIHFYKNLGENIF